MDAPELDLDWEQGLFRAMRSLWRKLRPAPKAAFDTSRAAKLSDLAPRLELIARLVGAPQTQVLPARRQGGHRGQVLLLPQWIDLGPDPQVNGALYLMRTVLGARLAQDGVPRTGKVWPDAWSMLRSVAATLPQLFEELPAYERVFLEAGALVLANRAEVTSEAQRVYEVALRSLLETGQLSQRSGPAGAAPPDPVVLWGRVMAEAVRQDGGGDGEELQEQRPETEVDAAPVEDLELLNLEEQRVLDLPTHVFEKVETAEDFSGSLRQLDGHDDLDDQLEALEEVDLRHLMRGGPDAAAMLRAEVGLEADIPDVGQLLPGEKGVPYDEWDGKKRRWRRDWCTVYPTPIRPAEQTPWVSQALIRQRRLINKVERELRASRQRPRYHPRQPKGEEVDIDAWVDSWADFKARGELSRRIYRERRPGPRELATMVLMDLSLSADSWVGGRRILDVCREAVLVLGEVSERLGDHLAILGFASNTRNHVRVFEVRTWGEPWALAKKRIEVLRPQGYTRIGPAVRHAAAQLDLSGAAKRQLIILTDGKPTDYDRYEGRYGLADTRRAIRDLRGEGVQVHALAIDRHARDGLSAMCGPSGWDLLPDPSTLPQALGRLYERLH